MLSCGKGANGCGDVDGCGVTGCGDVNVVVHGALNTNPCGCVVEGGRSTAEVNPVYEGWNSVYLEVSAGTTGEGG